MAINKKLIHFNRKEVFEEKLANNEILDTSIVFIKDSKEIWTHGQFYGGESMVNITYADLIELRNNACLIPGMQYRITDYVTTTKQEDTKSAGHQFDIIVTADSENTLNEKARAIQHDGDTYFSDSNLAAWEIWYSLDNDTERFAWADTTNGKGVIYRMIDEFGNDCPYDFKNIMFKRYTVSINNERLQQFESDIANKYIGFNANETYNVSMPDGLSINDDFKYFFTFDYNNQDFSLNDIGECRHNLIKDVRFLNEDLNYKMLNNIVFVVDDPISLINKNKFESDCYYMTIGHGTVSQIWSNIFDQYCRGCIIISSSIYQNKFGGNFLKT